MTENPKETWADGAAYERYVGRWSRLVAREFLDWLAAPRGGRWLDVGCGTGALSQNILTSQRPSRVEAIDRSPQYAWFVRAASGASKLQVVVADAEAIPIANGAHDVVVSGLALNFVPDFARAAAEMARVARPGGTVAAYVWDYAGKMEFMRYFWDVAIAVDARAEELDEGPRFPICNPTALEGLFESVALSHVEVRAIDIPTVFRDFDDYWSPFLGGQGPAPAFLLSLDPAGRVALREQLRGRLPSESDGSIRLVARAWAVRGRRQRTNE